MPVNYYHWKSAPIQPLIYSPICYRTRFTGGPLTAAPGCHRTPLSPALAPMGESRALLWHAKLLLPQTVIGNVTNILPATGCAVKMSSPRPQDIPSVLPGEKLVALTGLQSSMEQAIVLLINALRDAEALRKSVVVEVKLVVPGNAVSPIIGKGGSKVHQLRESTGTKIQISSRDSVSHARNEMERVVTVTGVVDAVRNAVIAILSIVQEDHLLPVPLPTATAVTATSIYHDTGLSASESGAKDRSALPNLSDTSKFRVETFVCTGGPLSVNSAIMEIHTELFMQVPDDYIGFLVGRSGQHLTDIRTTSGAKILISQRGELVPGTRDRLVTISGVVRSVHTAHMLILQRLAEFQDNNGQHQPDETAAAV